MSFIALDDMWLTSRLEVNSGILEYLPSTSSLNDQIAVLWLGMQAQRPATFSRPSSELFKVGLEAHPTKPTQNNGLVLPSPATMVMPSLRNSNIVDKPEKQGASSFKWFNVPGTSSHSDRGTVQLIFTYHPQSFLPDSIGSASHRFSNRTLGFGCRSVWRMNCPFRSSAKRCAGSCRNRPGYCSHWWPYTGHIWMHLESSCPSCWVGVAQEGAVWKGGLKGRDSRKRAERTKNSERVQTNRMSGET